MSVSVKICGIKDSETLHAAVQSGADYLGFVLIPESKRYVTISKAREILSCLPHPALCRFAKAGPDKAGNEITLTALFSDPSDEAILQALSLRPFLGLLQLHGRETPERVLQIRALSGVPVMKVIHVATQEDLADVPNYEKAADMLLFDTKTGVLPTGGTGLSFDWRVLKTLDIQLPWMLAGGLNAGNVRKAVKLSGARCVDVSSGVETNNAKDLEKIRDFIRMCHDLP